MRQAIILAGLLLAVPAFAQSATPPAKPAGNPLLGKHDNSAPIHVAAGHFESDVKAENGDYVGNVIVTQGDMKMRADRVHFDTTKGDLSIVTAIGNVVVDAPSGTGTGDHGVYDLSTHLVTLTGKVVLTKQKNVMRGTKLVMDLNTNLAHLTSDGAQGGRVEAVLVPKQQTQKNSAGGTTPKPTDNSGK